MEIKDKAQPDSEWLGQEQQEKVRHMDTHAKNKTQNITIAKKA